MPNFFSNKVFLILFIAIATILAAIIPNIVSVDIESWLKQVIGISYKQYLMGLMLLGFTFTAYLSFFLVRKRFYESLDDKQKRYEILPTEWNHTQLKKAQRLIGQFANLKEALHALSEIKSNLLQTELLLLSARLTQDSRKQYQGVISDEETSRAFNQLTKDVLHLIENVEKELQTEQTKDQTIRTSLQKRYASRLGQKLSGRQPINLKYFPSTQGTSEDTNLYFVFKGDEEIQQGIAQIFRESEGRLLIIGEPGAGKTTLLLQIAIELVQSEYAAIPVILNLATWKAEFLTLETWLEEVLPSELVLAESESMNLLNQNRLILFLDGLDEIKEEDREACLAAIGSFGSSAKRRFLITSRKNEYIQLAKDAPVYAQIEVRPLSTKQIITELEKIGFSQPEAHPLILALQKDQLLGEVAQTPFYFNLLQLLFASGKHLNDFNFRSDNIENRRKDVLEYFIKQALTPKYPGDYTEKQLQRWLAFFASRLKLKNLVNFELTNLQYDWWSWSWWNLILPRFVRNFSSSSLAGVLFLIGIIGLAYPGLRVVAFIYFMFLSLSALILVENKKLPKITTTEKIKFARLKILKIKWDALSLQAILAALFPMGLTILTLNFNKTITSWFFKDTSLAQFEILFWSIVVEISVLLLSFAFAIIINMHVIAIYIVKPYDRFVASSKWLHFSILQYGLLCLQLWIRNLLPFKLVKFLNEMANRHVLEFTGGGWRFQHRLIQDYFADMWERQYQEASLPKLKLIDADKYYELARDFYNQNKLDEALENFQIAVQLNPKKAESYGGLGNIYFHKKKYDKAIEFQKKAIQISPRRINYHCNLGVAYYNLGRYEDAINSFKKALKINPIFSDVYVLLGNTYCAQHEWPKAVKQYKTAIYLAPQNALIYFKLSKAQLEEHDYVKAEKNIKKAIKLESDNAEYYNVLRNILFQQKKYELAVSYFSDIIKTHPKLTACHYYLGLSYHWLKQYDQALLNYEKTVQISPNYTSAYRELASIYYERNNFEKAIESYLKIINIDPNSSETYNHIAIVLGDQKKHLEATLYLQKAIALDPDCDLYHANLTVALIEQNRIDEALESISNTLRLNPNSVDGWLDLGRCHILKRELVEAQQAFRKLAELPEQILGQASRFLGHIELMLGNTDVAIELYRTGLALAGDKEDFVERMQGNFDSLKMADFISQEDFKQILAQLDTEPQPKDQV